MCLMTNLMSIADTFGKYSNDLLLVEKNLFGDGLTFKSVLIRASKSEVFANAQYQSVSFKPFYWQPAKPKKQTRDVIYRTLTL